MNMSLLLRKLPNEAHAGCIGRRPNSSLYFPGLAFIQKGHAGQPLSRLVERRWPHLGTVELCRQLSMIRLETEYDVPVLRSNSKMV